MSDDPTTVCPFCKREHDTPELLELQSRLDRIRKAARNLPPFNSEDLLSFEADAINEIEAALKEPAAETPSNSRKSTPSTPEPGAVDANAAVVERQ